MKRKLRAGIIGLGVGQEHIKGYLSHPFSEVKSICDFNQRRLNGAARRFSISNMTTEPKDVLNDPDIDVVSICSYDCYHAQQVIQALRNGKHVMVEKPICLYENEAKEILRILRKSKLRLTSNLILRRSPRFVELKKNISENLFGKIFYAEGDYLYGRAHKITHGWRGKLDFYCGLYGGGIHLIDLLMWLVGNEIKEVFSYGNKICTKNSVFKFEDCIATLLKFNNGCVAKTMTSLCCIQPHFHALKIYGTKATFINNYKNADLFFSTDLNKVRKANASYPGVKKGDLIPNFIDAILKKQKLYVDEEQIFNVMSVCFASYESLLKGVPVKVKYLYRRKS